MLHTLECVRIIISGLRSPNVLPLANKVINWFGVHFVHHPRSTEPQKKCGCRSGKCWGFPVSSSVHFTINHHNAPKEDNLLLLLPIQLKLTEVKEEFQTKKRTNLATTSRETHFIHFVFNVATTTRSMMIAGRV